MSATLATTVELFLAELERSSPKPSTIKAYRRELSAAAAVMNAPLEQLSSELLQQWTARHHAAPATVARRRAMLRRMFRWAIATQRSRVDPFEQHVRRPVYAPARPPTAKQRPALEAALDLAPMPYRLAFVLLSETSLRINELLALTMGDVCIVPGHESLRTKARSGRGARIVLLGRIATPRSLRLLHNVIHVSAADGAGQPLLRGSAGPVSYSALRYQWNRLCLRTGLVDDAGAPRYTLVHLNLARRGDHAGPRGLMVAPRQADRPRPATRTRPITTVVHVDRENQ